MCAAVVDEVGCIAEFLRESLLFIGGEDSLLLFCFVLEYPIGTSVFRPNTALLSQSIPSLRLCVLIAFQTPRESLYINNSTREDVLLFVSLKASVRV
jgi:hypothetical protein